jgi:hypothetical protein
LFQIETITNCPVIRVTEKTILNLRVSHFWGPVPGCLVITVTENRAKLWSITLCGGVVLDKDSSDAVFYQLAIKYRWLETKKEKSDFIIEIEKEILPMMSIKPMHRKSLHRKLKNSILDSPKKKRGRRAIYNDFDKQHLKKIWVLSGYPYGKRLKALLP